MRVKQNDGSSRRTAKSQISGRARLPPSRKACKTSLRSGFALSALDDAEGPTGSKNINWENLVKLYREKQDRIKERTSLARNPLLQVAPQHKNAVSIGNLYILTPNAKSNDPLGY
jgi:hypothetical protein